MLGWVPQVNCFRCWCNLDVQHLTASAGGGRQRQSIKPWKKVPRLAIHISCYISRAQKLWLLFETPCHDLSSNTKFQAIGSRTGEFCTIEANKLDFYMDV